VAVAEGQSLFDRRRGPQKIYRERHCVTVTVDVSGVLVACKGSQWVYGIYTCSHDGDD